ncbi:MAG: hypothetical protein BWK79_02825 [Beggiatoa sp. IS2]|nr:MAG: hypothetical protein BWK79_02825 [Beggiatoa sp. IS2]
MNLLTYFYLALTLFLLFLGENGLTHEIITRVSTNAYNTDANGHSLAPSLSADGRYIAFHSEANNLVANDNNGFSDIFVYDRYTQQTSRVSVNSNGEEANFVSAFPAISADGRYVTFHSDATNLVAQDENRTTDIFLHDRDTGTTTLVSVNNDGQQGNLASSTPAISADGRYIAFYSAATNLVADDTNESLDIFVYDRQTQQTSRVSVDSQGKQSDGASFGAAISADGRFVAFTSTAANLVKNDNNDSSDLFVYDRDTGKIECVSINSKGRFGNASSYDPTLSADGRLVAFASKATNLVTGDTNRVDDVFVYDRDTAQITRVSVDSNGQQANALSFAPTLSGDGRYVTFNSNASNLVANDDNDSTDVFIYNRQTGQTHRLTLLSQSFQDNSTTFYPPAISSDGRLVAFESAAWNLVADDTNDSTDIFLYDRAYPAQFTVATGELHLPALMVTGLGLFRATLQLLPTNDTTALQFAIHKVSSLPVPLTDVTATYDPATGNVQLPFVEVINPPQLLQQFAVNLFLDTATNLLTVTQLSEK